ncbi:hypothetical protein BH20ACT6_BH20ACT6_24750 [soil metagenome]
MAGCAASVPVDSPVLDGERSRQCAALAERAPDSVAGAERREVETTGVALAWGDPPIVLRCGVPVPAALKPGARCDTIDDVDWFTRGTADGFVFTTIGRATTVEVRVPDDYEPAGDALIDVGGAVRASVPVEKRCL